MQVSPISAESILEQLSKILSSSLFANADQSRALLKFVVEQTVNQRTDRLKEYTVGAEALGRGESFDPRTDTIVRAEASRLRSRLERYYAAEGRDDQIEIALPKGSYIPQFMDRVTDRGPYAETTVIPVVKDEKDKEETPRRLHPTWIKIAATAAVVGAGIWGLLMLQRARSGSVSQPVVQFTISSPPGTIFEPPIARQSFAISPDGTRLAFTATDASGTRIWIRDLAALDMKAVPGTEGARTVFWSPDSRSLFYSIRRQFMQANLDTGSSRSVATLPYSAMYGSWRSKNDLLLYLGPRSFYELLVNTGSLRELPDTSMRWAQFLPGTDRFVHVLYDPALARYRALATDYVTQKSVTLMETDSRVQYAPPIHPGKPGYLLFIRGGSLLAQPFDAVQLRLTGEPFPLVQNVTYFSPSASGCFSVSENGVLVYQSGYPPAELRWYDRAGNVIGTVGKPAPFNGTVRISPDGQHLIAGVWSPANGGIDIWTFNESGTESRRLTFPPAVHPRSVWSPQGTRIAFASTRTGAPSLATLDLAEQSKEESVMNDAAKPLGASQIQLPTDWSRDGRFILYDTSLGEEERKVWLADTSSGNVMPLLQNESSQLGAAFSPDGKRIAFISDQSGRPEVYVQTFEAAPSPHLVGERHQVSTDGAWIVRWRPDGRELFYVGVDNWLHTVPVAGPPQFGESKALFRIAGTSQYGTMSDFQFDVTPDGQRFIISTTGSRPPPDFTVIENWQEKFHR
jgi:eukaryotic-like serine/threonine-protein kinase